MGEDSLPEKEQLEEAATIKRLEYSQKKQTAIAKKAILRIRKRSWI